MKLSHIFTTVITIVIAIFVFTKSAQAEFEQTVPTQLYSSKGYPYATLISRSDEVKIFYRENGGEVQCRTELLWNNKKIETTEVKTNKSKFTQLPLASCLTIDTVKIILAGNFENYSSDIFSPSNILENSVGL